MTSREIEVREPANRNRSSGNVAMELDKSYAQFARIDLSNNDVIRHRTTA